MTSRGLVGLLALVALVLLAVFVWPTRYRVLPVGPETGGHTVRVDRFNGKRDVKTAQGNWVPIEVEQVQSDAPVAPNVPAVPSSPGAIQKQGDEIKQMHEAAQETMDQHDPLRR